MHRQRSLKQWLPERQRQAEPRILDEPRPVHVEVAENQTGGRREAGSLLVAKCQWVEAKGAVPCGARGLQHRIVELHDVEPLPKTFGVFIVCADGERLGREVAPQQVQNPGHCGCARTVHSQHKQLHVLFPASFRRFHDAT